MIPINVYKDNTDFVWLQNKKKLWVWQDFPNIIGRRNVIEESKIIRSVLIVVTCIYNMSILKDRRTAFYSSRSENLCSSSSSYRIPSRGQREKMDQALPYLGKHLVILKSFICEADIIISDLSINELKAIDISYSNISSLEGLNK